MAEDLVSCIVPVFNGERYLAEALESIVRQTYRQFEIIVVDDGSTDGTANVLASFGAPIRRLWQPNAGPAAARNLALDAVEGRFVAFLDADDFWPPEKLACQMARFAARPELEICLAHRKNFWIAELSDEARRLQNHALMRVAAGYLTAVARRQLFDSVGRFNTGLRHGSELEWFVRAAEQGVVSELLPDILEYRRLHFGNRSRDRDALINDEHLQIVKAHLDRRRLRKSASPRSGQSPRSDEDR